LEIADRQVKERGWSKTMSRDWWCIVKVAAKLDEIFEEFGCVPFV
jgi:hypothetical protein